MEALALHEAYLKGGDTHEAIERIKHTLQVLLLIDRGAEVHPALMQT